MQLRYSIDAYRTLIQLRNAPLFEKPALAEKFGEKVLDLIDQLEARISNMETP